MQNDSKQDNGKPLQAYKIKASLQKISWKDLPKYSKQNETHIE